MLFALQSMAKRMSPVLSSYVTQAQHEPAAEQSQVDAAHTEGELCQQCVQSAFGSALSSALGSAWQMHDADIEM